MKAININTTIKTLIVLTVATLGVIIIIDAINNGTPL